jgi:hypothetical protein
MLRADGFAAVSAEEGVKLTKQELDQFSTCWAELDPQATMFIKIEKLYSLFQVRAAPYCSCKCDAEMM